MTRDEREALSQHICNFCCDSSNKSVKTTVNYFIKQNIPRRTVYYILNTYLSCETTKDQSRSGRPLKLADKQLNNIVKSVNNRSRISQRKIGRRFHVRHSTLSRNFRKRTSIHIRKHRTAPKIDGKDQEKRAKTICGKLCRKLFLDFDPILNHKNFFTSTGDNVIGNRFFYSTDITTAPADIKFRKKKKCEPKIMVWMTMSSKGVSYVYVHQISHDKI